MASWLAPGRLVVELYLLTFSLLSQGVLVASTLVDVLGRLVPQLWDSALFEVGILLGVSAVLLADRLELLFLSGLRMVRTVERAGWERVGALLRRLLRRLVATSYVPRPPDDRAGSARDLFVAFLTVYSSDAHYPRASWRTVRRSGCLPERMR
jgi:hypothetical protein